MALRRVLAVLFGLLVLTGGAAVASASPSEESEFVALINQSRAASGLAPLAVDADLVAGARAHTAEMIPTGSIFHSTSSQLAAVTTGWEVLGENVGKGPDAPVLHSAFMASPSHKANILGSFDRVGVGVGHDAEGKMYVTVMFMRTLAGATTTTTTVTTTTTPTPTTTTPVTTTTTTTTTTAESTPGSTEDAGSGTASRPSASAVERPDLSPRTLGLEVFGAERFVPGTYCVSVRAFGSICIV